MAKRRASGPAVTKSPTRTRAAASSGGSSKKPGKSAPAKGRWKRRILKTFAWLTVLGLLGVIFAAGAFVYVYNKTEIPDPNAEFLT